MEVCLPHKIRKREYLRPKEEPQGKAEGETWAISRKAKRAMIAEAKKEAEKSTIEKPISSPQSKPAKPARSAGKKREPRTAAVTVTCPPGTYEKNLRKARQKMEKKGINLEGAKIRREVTGSYVFEIPGVNKQERADKFALRLREAFKGKEGVKVQRPTKMTKIRLRGLNESIRAPEVVKAIATAGDCYEEKVHLGEIRKTPAGVGMVWTRCPLKAANTIIKTAQIKIGWAVTRVEILQTRPLQCYKSLEGGHVRARCPNTVDRSDVDPDTMEVSGLECKVQEKDNL
ncbi:uncharacterized protein LOC114939873 [Nylanderia fulva]|uniref:uncharacterized protein LOC114939873 n=1 Tax=Nylanderia fulva TaxID=613905 RepID=UPI0010FB3866|nr:uncharacterized protein LOC114939873 [Nylanderia fulva]